MAATRRLLFHSQLTTAKADFKTFFYLITQSVVVFAKRSQNLTWDSVILGNSYTFVSGHRTLRFATRGKTFNSSDLTIEVQRELQKGEANRRAAALERK